MWLLVICESSNHTMSLTKHINEFSFQHNKLSKLLSSEKLNMLDMKPKDLFNKSGKNIQKEIAGHYFDDDTRLEILRNNPCMIKGPFDIMNKSAAFCISPRDIYQLADLHIQQR